MSVTVEGVLIVFLFFGGSLICARMARAHYKHSSQLEPYSVAGAIVFAIAALFFAWQYLIR